MGNSALNIFWLSWNAIDKIGCEIFDKSTCAGILRFFHREKKASPFISVGSMNLFTVIYKKELGVKVHYPQIRTLVKVHHSSKRRRHHLQAAWCPHCAWPRCSRSWDGGQAARWSRSHTPRSPSWGMIVLTQREEGDISVFKTCWNWAPASTVLSTCLTWGELR